MTVDKSNPLQAFDWSSLFTHQTYVRGIEYAAEDRVRQCTPLDDSGFTWSGKVAGSGKKIYACLVTLIPPMGNSKPRLYSKCDCPMVTDCKHVAALLCQAEWQCEASEEMPSLPPSKRAPNKLAADNPRQQIDPLSNWARVFEHQASTSTTTIANSKTEHKEVGILIRAAAYSEPPKLLASLVMFRRGQNDQLVEPISLMLAGGNLTMTPPDGWQASDLFALHLLVERQVERIGTVQYAPLQGLAQERALVQLLSRYPAYFERAANPLTLGPNKTISLKWHDLPNGNQRLAYAMDDAKNMRLLEAEGLWYLNTASGQLGQIDGGKGMSHIAKVAPALLPEQVAAMRSKLAATTPPSPIPLPAERPAVQRIETTPLPVLSLFSFQPTRPLYGRYEKAPTFGAARIGFDYGGQLLGSGGTERERLWRDGSLFDVVRHRGVEQQWLQRWRALNLLPLTALPWQHHHTFSELPNGNLLLVNTKSGLPQRPDGWLDTLRQLAAEGVRLEYEGDFPRPLRDVDAGEWDIELNDTGNAWFELSLGIDIEGERVDLLPILRHILTDPSFSLRPTANERTDARWRFELDQQRAVILPLAKLRTLIAPLLDWLQQDGPLRLHRSQASAVNLLPTSVRWRGDARLHKSLLDLNRRPKAAKAPAGFKAKLRPYQCEGLAWLNLLGEAGLGGILADDMGLGKTVQVLAHLLAEKKRLGGQCRTLVVAPTSLMGNWHAEAARFAPALKTLVLHGPDRGDRYDDIATHELILTTYPLLSRDRERLLTHKFDLLVLDEAQAIKNAKSQAAQVVRELHATRRLAMTGTPLENHLGELWAQFDAVEPGVLGSDRDFTRLYRTPIEKHGDMERQQRLNRRIAPLLLRRRKDEVLKDLPAKTEIIRMLEIDGGQRELYETLRLAQHKRVREAVSQRGLAQSGIVVLDALLKLRQACCDPRLVKLPAARKVKASAKLDALMELLTTLLDEGRKVLLFSQFTGMLDLIEPSLNKQGIDFLRLDGSTPGQARANLVQRFQNGEAPLFLISLKAGGVGLNLTAADTVIHYDPWWNPAVEQQATDRAHRIGQNKPVFVYKLICQGTVEEKILALQTRKAALAQAVLDGGRSTQLKFTESDLTELFAPMR